MKTIAVIGTGIMGAGIASNYLKHGYPVIVWNRTADRLKPLLEQGARAASSPKEAAQEADIVFEVTADDASSRTVWTGADGILAGTKEGSVLIASGTFSLGWIDELAKLCTTSDKTFFDMPLTGSRAGAEGGTLVLLVGGDAEHLETIKPDLAAISSQVLYFGNVGAGTKYKLLLNMLQAIHMIGFAEVIRLATALGLDEKIVGDALAERPGGTTTNIAWRGHQQPPDQTNFAVQWITKDLDYMKNSAPEFGNADVR